MQIMKKSVLAAIVCFSTLLISKAQTLNFDNIPLPGPESYRNGSDGSTGIGTQYTFFFPTVWDTSFGGYWSNGFALSNMTDSVTSGFTNMYSAKAGSGYNQSSNYLVAYKDYYFTNLGFKVESVRITNNTYAYNSMRDGDQFAKKFGGLSGNDPDYFRVVFKGYLLGNENPDSVTFYLADYRFSDNTQDYLVRDWTSVSLAELGNVDSVTYRFESSDMGDFGINTPTYFCMDQIYIMFSLLDIDSVGQSITSLLYPNPASQSIFFKEEIRECTVYNSLGQLMFREENLSGAIDVSSWENGVYLFLARGKQDKVQQIRIVVSH
jgi:hypothetical protein